MIKKSDLVNGMLVEADNWMKEIDTWIVVKGAYNGDLLIREGGWMSLDAFDEDLQPIHGNLKIHAVFTPKDTSYGWCINKEDSMWERHEVTKPVKVIEMTLAEVEEKLGYKVKIKEEKTKETKSGRVKYKIVDIGRNDAFYNRREQLIGKVVYSDDLDSWDNGWKFGHFTFNKPVKVDGKVMDSICFHQVELEEIE